MDTPVFKLWLVKPGLEILTEQAAQAPELFEKNTQIQKELGARQLVYGSVWSKERFTWFGVEWFPTWKEVREHNRRLDELHWFQFFMQIETFLGVEDPSVPVSLEALDIGADPIAQIWLSHWLPVGYDTTAEDIPELPNYFAAIKALGVRSLFNINALPMDEQWNSWGINLILSMDALLENNRLQAELKWWKYMQARTFLGTIQGGELVKK